MTDIIKRDKRRALVYRAAMELVDQVYGEAVEAANKGEGPGLAGSTAFTSCWTP